MHISGDYMRREKNSCETSVTQLVVGFSVPYDFLLKFLSRTIVEKPLKGSKNAHIGTQNSTV